MMSNTPVKRVQSKQEHIGCMHGLVDMFYIRHGGNSKTLLTGSSRSHTSGGHSFRKWFLRKRNKLKRLTNGEDKHCLKHFDHPKAEKTNFSSARVKTVKDQSISLPSSGSVSYSDKSLKETTRNFGVSNHHLVDDSRGSTALDAYQSHLLDLDEGFCSNINIVALLEEIYSKKPNDQQFRNNKIHSYPSEQDTIGKKYEHIDWSDVQLLQDQKDPILEKALDELLDNLILKLSDTIHTTSDGTRSQSEDLMKVLETLSSNREIFLKVLHDPNSLLVKYFQNLRTADALKSSASISCQAENDISEHFEGSSGLDQHRKKILHDFFLEGTSKGTVPSREPDDSQKVNRIVVLKPNTSGSQSSSDVNDPSSSPHSSYSSGSNRGKESVALAFFIQEVKRRLKQAFRMNTKDSRTYEDMQRGQCESQASRGIPEQESKDSSSSDSVGSSNSRKSLLFWSANRREVKVKSKEFTSNIESESTSYKVDSSNSLNVRKMPNSQLRDSINLRKDKHHFVNMTNGGDSNGHSGDKMSDTMEEFPRIPSQKSSSKFSPKLGINSKQYDPLGLNKAGGGDIDRNYTLVEVGSAEVSTHMQESVSTTETSSPKCSDDNMDQEHSCRDEISQSSCKDHADIRCENIESSPCSTLDFSEEKLQLNNHLESSLLIPYDEIMPESSEKPKQPSLSAPKSLFLDKIVKPRVPADKRRKPPRKPRIEEHDASDFITMSSNLMMNLQTCAGDDEFKFGYMRALLEAFDLCNFDPLERGSGPLLNSSFYDEVETPNGEAPDDLRLLFDCINEVLEEIYERSSSCLPHVSSNTSKFQPFPRGEELIREAWKGLKIRFVPWAPKKLVGIIKRDLEFSRWMDIRCSVEEIGVQLENEILDKVLEETILELWE